MFNSRIGDLTMAGADKESLTSLHGPIVYIVGRPSDVAHPNALLDYDRIGHVPVAFTSLDDGCHMGTFRTEFGGSFSRLALDWLDWRLKGIQAKAGVFVQDDHSAYPGWTIRSKNFRRRSKMKGKLLV